MIYITGDTHGDRFRFIRNTFNDENMETKPYTICFCDGNHENFPAIFSYPQKTWNGGKVHCIRKNILHLMRGQVFTIDNKKIFTMGGAYSIDRYMRTLNYSYWEEELPNNEEYSEAVKNLKEHKKLDIIITHTAPKEIIRRMGFTPDAHDIELTGFLEWVMHEVDFTHWYFGHWHLDQTVHDKLTAVYLEVHCVK